MPGTLWILLLLVAVPLVMILMRRGQGGHGGQGRHGTHGGRHDAPAELATVPVDPRAKVADGGASHAGHSEDASEQDAGGDRHRGC